MPLLDMPDFKVESSMPSGIKTKIIVQASNNLVYLRNYANDSMVYPFTHPYVRVPDQNNLSYIYGIEKAYNITTGRDVTGYIDVVSDDGFIKFLPSYVADGDNIELTLYTTFLEIMDGDKVLLEWVEQIYRHASSLDRTDFGNYTPPIKYHLDNSVYSSTKYTFHPRLFYACCGYPRDKEGFNGDLNTGLPITAGASTLISWGANNPHSVGIFAGDQALANTKGGNSNYVIAPVPFYITKIYMITKMKTDTFSADSCPAIVLDVEIDGNTDVLSSGPSYIDSYEKRVMNACFGTDSKLILPFSGDFNYAGAPPGYYTGDMLEDTDGSATYSNYYCHEIKTGIIRASTLKISAKVVGERADSDPDKTKTVDEWYLCVSGWIPKCY